MNEQMFDPSRLPARDEDGYTIHPDLDTWRASLGIEPESEEPIDEEKLKGAGFEAAYVFMQGDVDALDSLSIRYFELGESVPEWQPTPPGPEWLLVAVYDTEDGPCAMFVRRLAERTVIDEKSVAHLHGMNSYGLQAYPDGRVPWRAERAPDLQSSRTTTGRLRSCGYCGSMHPADVAEAIRKGAQGSWADWKYGWPHKAYFDNIPNPHVGMLESRTSCSSPPQAEIDAGKWIKLPTGSFSQATGEKEYWWHEAGKPAAATTYGKFYSVHLQDATPADRAVIEQHLGLAFEFTKDGRVAWRKIPAPATAEVASNG